MITPPHWLPPLVLLGDSQGNFEKYLDAVYACFVRDFVHSQTIFQGWSVLLKRHPMALEREATFWHLISSGKEEADRLPDVRRCERISWPRAIIDHASDPLIKCWENQRRGETRVLLWLETVKYLVILARRERYYLLWTAYQTEREHTIRSLQREYERALKKLTPPQP